MEYFCDMCLSTWKRVRDGELNHFMQPCSTCDGMMTWGKDVRESARRVLEVWGYAVENVDSLSTQPGITSLQQYISSTSLAFMAFAVTGNASLYMW